MKRQIGWHAALLLYVAFIYFNSLTPAALSSQESSSVLRLIHGVLGELGLAAPWITEHVVRKCAHFGEYFILGMLLTQSLNGTGLKREGRVLGQLCLTAAVPLIDASAVYAGPFRTDQRRVAGYGRGCGWNCFFLSGRRSFAPRQTNRIK